jgi:curved DNA-binding protein CbpA
MGSSLAKRAALLCHPDRHPDGRKREATEVTQALLDVANGGRRFEARSLGR